MRCSKLVFFVVACMIISTLYVQNVEAGKKKFLKGVLGAGLVLAALKPKIVPLPLPLPLLPPPPPEEALAHYHHLDLAALHHAGFHHGGYHAAHLYDLPHAHHAHAHHIAADYHHGHHYPLW